MKRLPEAEQALGRALALQRELLPADDLRIAETLRMQAGVALLSGRPEDAAALYREVLVILDRSSGDASDRKRADVLTNLAQYELSRGRQAEALKEYRKALALRERLSPDSEALAMLLNDMAVAHAQLGHIGEAEAALNRALPMLERALGPEHKRVKLARNNLAALRASRAAPGP